MSAQPTTKRRQYNQIDPDETDRAHGLQGRRRVVIENVNPEINCGRFPIKRVVAEDIVVQADVFADGQDTVSALLLHRREGERDWTETKMRHLNNDRWQGRFCVQRPGKYYYTLVGFLDQFMTCRNDLQKKLASGQDVDIEIQIVAKHLSETLDRVQTQSDRRELEEIIHVLQSDNVDAETKAQSVIARSELAGLVQKYSKRRFQTIYPKELEVIVERSKAMFSTWYEMFPRSCSSSPGRHGTFTDCERVVSQVAEMGFDVLYLPPIHPIGRTNRKGKNNSPDSRSADPGSPWAIGSRDGGHNAIHPQLGTLRELESLVKKAEAHRIEIALDLAFHGSPDHPYVREHPEWFRWRPDGTIRYAENPPKKYEDVVPFDFETEKWQDLWEELRNIVTFWIQKGIRIFRVDNPHTKPFVFWEWLIEEIRKTNPDVIFLSEAFTRPKVMYRLAKAGFSQSYTYFTWRNTKRELMEYLTELTQTDVREYFRPNFWPNTPDILPEYLQYGGRPAFVTRLVLAATLSSSYGIYGPPYELCVNEAAQGREEYLNSEKYEIKDWDRNKSGNLARIISRVNRIRRENPALQTTRNLRFYNIDNENMICYEKATRDLSNVIVVVANLDPFHRQSGWLEIPTEELGIEPNQPYLMHDLLGDEKYIWQERRNQVELDPNILPVHVFRMRRRLRRETDFDYFM